ncbi:hypothetical protein C8R45DRAFT_1074236 [Mycena sanguinolenta]|nr:hypothetical protein C8R45DRAFT_1074236 [Mycena sanguinolenta]
MPSSAYVLLSHIAVAAAVTVPAARHRCPRRPYPLQIKSAIPDRLPPSDLNLVPPQFASAPSRIFAPSRSPRRHSAASLTCCTRASRARTGRRRWRQPTPPSPARVHHCTAELLMSHLSQRQVERNGSTGGGRVKYADEFNAGGDGDGGEGRKERSYYCLETQVKKIQVNEMNKTSCTPAFFHLPLRTAKKDDFDPRLKVPLDALVNATDLEFFQDHLTLAYTIPKPTLELVQSQAHFLAPEKLELSIPPTT